MPVETKRPLDFQYPIRCKIHSRQMQRERNSRLRAQFMQCSGALNSAHIPGLHTTMFSQCRMAEWQRDFLVSDNGAAASYIG